MSGMTLIEDAGPTWFSHPEYKEGRPPDRALLVSDGTRCVVLNHVGPALDYWLDELGLGDDEWAGLAAGVWIWEGSIKVYGGGMFEDRDEELDGTERLLTDEEWEHFRDEGTAPWDTDDWIAVYPGPPAASVVEGESS